MSDDDLYLHLAAIVDSSDDAIISKDLTGRIKSFNAAAERLFGYTAAEIVGQSILLLIPEDRHQEETEILARLSKGERIEHFETIRRAKNGRLIEISLTVSPVRNESGTIIGASKIARDISDRRRAQVTSAELAAIVESSDDVILSKDLVGTIRSFNKAAERMLGYTAAEIVGQSILKVVPPELRHEEQEILDRIRLGRVIEHYETVRVTKDGRRVDVSLTVSPIRGPSGEVVGASSIARDITEQKRAALERERLLHNERAARTEAERANRVKDDFVAMVSHELRTPLNAILGWTDLLKSAGGDTDLLARGVDVIARNTRLQAQVIGDLLDVSRIVSGKIALDLSRLDLTSIVTNSVEALQSPALEKGVALTTRIALGPIATVGDPARLQQIVWNLLSNAIKFTPKGGSVTVELRRLDGHAEIVVTDTGAGIPSDFLPDLFERFRQASAMTTRRHGGLGLGLSIAKHLTELHGGSIRASSRGEGKGATFVVTLPLKSEEPMSLLTDRRRDSDEAAAQAGKVSLTGLSVLVIEDDQDTRDLIRRLLESHRAHVVVAATAPEALEVLQRDRPDMIVSDIGLPDVDGYELIRRIRGLDDALAQTPAVALTAFARFEDRTRALAAGFNAHVAKPVEPSELVITVGSFANLIAARRRVGVKAKKVGRRGDQDE
ncbi:MAG: PAS domain S-box protein [Acidobacteriota bacterium]